MGDLRPRTIVIERERKQSSKRCLVQRKENILYFSNFYSTVDNKYVTKEFRLAHDFHFHNVAVALVCSKASMEISIINKT